MAETCEITLDIEGMHCQSCANTITNTLKEKGLKDVNVNYSSNEASFVIDKKEKLADIIKSIERVGYKAHVHGEEDDETKEKPNYDLEIRLVVCAILTLPLFLHMFLPFEALHNPLVQLIVCLPVFTIGILYFGKSAWGSLLAKSPNMDVLITMGFSAAFIYSLIAMRHYPILPAHPFFFETSATIVTLVLLGNFMEKRSVKQTTSALTELLKIQKQKAHKLHIHNGKEELIETDYHALQIGDILQVVKGESIPVDGIITEGTASINESMVSGEAIPVSKKAGDPVIGGTIIVNGHLRMKAEKVGKDTVVAHIIDMVKKAQGSAPKIQRIGDRISAVFVPVVIGISIITFVIAYFLVHVSLENAFLNSIAVLVIACPCAMGLATPTAIAVALGKAAQRGILIKGASTMEALVEIKNVALDKTGTLTTGTFSIKNIGLLNGATKDQVENILFSMEQYSTHPIAQSITAGLKEKASKISLKDIHEEEGVGMKASDNAGHNYNLGSYKIAEKLSTDSQHSIYLLQDEKLIATVDLEDTLRKHAETAMAELKKAGIHTVMISGDKEAKCKEIATKLGIDEVYAEQLPYQKLDQIDRLSKSSPTAMVGDGINDAPALALASVGISLGAATKIAMQSAQVILLGDNDLSQLPRVFTISKTTLRIIKQNLFWALLYNVIAIPFAATGVLSPMLSALAMSFSDVIVVGNSLRLKRLL
jgi:Cu+-exporting ATPase